MVMKGNLPGECAVDRFSSFKLNELASPLQLLLHVKVVHCEGWNRCTPPSSKPEAIRKETKVGGNGNLQMEQAGETHNTSEQVNWWV